MYMYSMTLHTIYTHMCEGESLWTRVKSNAMRMHVIYGTRNPICYMYMYRYGVNHNMALGNEQRQDDDSVQSTNATYTNSMRACTHKAQKAIVLWKLAHVTRLYLAHS